MLFNIDTFLSLEYSMDPEKEKGYIKTCGFKPEELATHVVETSFGDKTVMQCIMDYSNTAPIENFYKMGMDFECVSCEGLTPLSYCVKVGDPVKFFQLLKLGVSPNVKNEDGTTLSELIEVSEDKEWFENLLKAGGL